MRSPKVPWWPGSVVSDSGVHLHHLVFGIVTMMIAGALGFAAFGEQPLDRDLRLRLRHRRRADDRRVRPLGLPRRRLLGRGGAQLDRRDRDRRRGDAAGPARLQPLQLRDGSIEAIVGSVLGAALVFLLVAICFAKGRVLHGTIGFFVFPIALYGACRLGKPGSRLGAPPLRRAAPEEAGQGRGALPARPPHRALQERLPRHRRRQAERGPGGGQATRRWPSPRAREASEEVRDRAERVTHPGEPD